MSLTSRRFALKRISVIIKQTVTNNSRDNNKFIGKFFYSLLVQKCPLFWYKFTNLSLFTVRNQADFLFILLRRFVSRRPKENFSRNPSFLDCSATPEINYLLTYSMFPFSLKFYNWKFYSLFKCLTPSLLHVNKHILFSMMYVIWVLLFS